MQDAAAGEYTFMVAKEANKAQIASDLAQTFGVKVLTVKTVTVPGKTRRVGKKRQKMTASSWKKAIAKLATGQKIALFDVTEEKPVTHTHD